MAVDGIGTRPSSSSTPLMPALIPGGARPVDGPEARRALGADRYEANVRATRSGAGPDRASATARANVDVSDTEVVNQREAVRGEAQAFAAKTQADLTARAAEIESHQNDPHYMVEIQERGDRKIYLERHIADDGTFDRETYLEVSKDQPPQVVLEETRREGDHYVQERREASGSGDHLEAQQSAIQFRQYPGAPLGMPNASLPPYDPERLSQSATSFRVEGNDVSKTEEAITGFNEIGQPTGMQRAIATFRERPPGDLDLQGGIEAAFDRSQPVIESQVSVVNTDAAGEQHILADEHHWSQGRVRASERTTEGGVTTLLLEKQSADGQSKDSQLFIKGAQETIRSHTQLNADGSVTESQELWDSNEGVVGRPEDTRPQLLQKTTTTQTYGTDGHLATLHRQSEDLRTGERRTEDYRRTVQNGIATYDTRQLVERPDGSRDETKVTETAFALPDGDQPFSTRIETGDHVIELREDAQGRHYTDTDRASGQVVRGEVRQTGEGIQLDLDGKTVDLNADGTFKQREQLDSLEVAELSALPFLATGAKGVKGLVSSFGNDPQAAEAALAQGIQGARHGADLKASAGYAFGVASGAYKVFNDIRTGDYLQAALDGARAGVSGAQLTGSLLGKFDAVSKLGRALGVLGGALDVATGVYGVFKADNSYDRAASGLNIVEGGLSIGLALCAASGPAAPFLFAGIVLIEGIKLWLDHEKAEYVAPLAEGLAA